MKGYTKDRFTGKEILKSPLKLQGAKTHTRDYLYQFFPEDCNSHTELFMGTNTVLIGAPIKCIERAVDINSYAINFFKTIQTNPDEFWGTFTVALNQYLKAEREGKGKEYFSSYKYSVTRTDCKILRAVYFYLITKTCFNGIWRINQDGECNSAYCNQVKGRGWLTKDWFDALCSRIEHITFYNKDYKACLQNLINPKAFVYLDPPYEYRSKKLPNGTVTTYNGIRFLEKDFREMHELLDKASYKWLMTVSDTPLMRELFKENYIVPWEVYYCSSEKSSSRGYKPELLIANYDIISIAEALKSKVDAQKEAKKSSKKGARQGTKACG